MSKTTYYYVIDAEGFYPKQAFDDATSFDSEQEAKDIARSYGGRVPALDFVTEGGEEWLDAESEAKVSGLEEEWKLSNTSGKPPSGVQRSQEGVVSHHADRVVILYFLISLN
jgi:hypothetical protein